MTTYAPQTFIIPTIQPEKPVLLQSDNQYKKYETLFVEIDSGQVKLPMFQRKFVWNCTTFPAK